MKRIATLLLFSTFNLLAFAGFSDGKLSVTHLGIEDIRVEIDGKNYGSDRLVVIDNLKSGYHTVKVYYKERQRGGNSSIARDWAQKPIYTGKIKMRGNYHVDIVINRFGKSLVDERLMDEKYRKDYGSDDDYAFDRNRRDNQYDRDRDNRDSRDRNDRDSRNNYNSRPTEPIKDQAFASLVETLRKESFETTRVKLAKQAVEQYSFMSVQVKQLLQLFSFEESRLDMAKYMYPLTIDKPSYFQVYDVFSFSASKEQLSAYVRDYR